MNYQYGFALGGGAARGLAHIGIMRAFYDQGVMPHALAGTSMGAVIASLLAIGMTPQQIETEIRNINVLSMLDFKPSKAGLMSGRKIYKTLKGYLGSVTFEQLKIPLRICAVDIENGTPVIFKEGPVLDAVRASLSIPGVFIPYEYQGRLLVDGGLMNNLPIDALEAFHCQHVLAISVRRSARTTLLYREYLKSEETFVKEFRYHRLKLVYDILKKTYDTFMREQENAMIVKNPQATVIVPQMDEFDYADFLKKDQILDASLLEGKRLVEEWRNRRDSNPRPSA